jgi:hypothetical protein
MTRRKFIEQVLRQIYNGQVTDDASITAGLVNTWMDSAIGVAAQQNYKQNYQIEGVAAVSNSFFTTFKGLVITADERNLYKFTLPEIPMGLGVIDGISRVVFKDSTSTVSYPAVMLTENQVSIQRQMRPIPNKICCYSEGIFCYAITPIILTPYTATCTMVSGGNASDLDSELNVPADFHPAMIAYIQQQLMIERKNTPDLQNDGRSN